MAEILVIKHGALGDVVLATSAFSAIREHHKQDHITLLTTPPYADLLRLSGYFDEIWIDSRPKLYNVISFFKLICKIHRGHFTRIYDLQTSERTSWYFRFLPHPKPEWVGTVKGASHQHNTPERTRLHTVERQKQQLAAAGIPELPKPSVNWLVSDIKQFKLPERYVLIVPGGSAHRPGKRWPASYYGTLSMWLARKGFLPVLIGTESETSVLSTIEGMCPVVKNLCGKTRFADIAELARSALCAVGNDTGPMHLIAAAGRPSLVLFSQFSDPALCAPRGKTVVVLREPLLANLLPQNVFEQLEKLF